MTDGEDVCRFVSFSPAKVKEELEGVKEKGGESLSLVNCDIKKSRIGSGYELVLSDKSSSQKGSELMMRCRLAEEPK